MASPVNIPKYEEEVSVAPTTTEGDMYDHIIKITNDIGALKADVAGMKAMAEGNKETLSDIKKSVADIASAVKPVAVHEEKIKRLESHQSWLGRTIVGSLIVTGLGWIYAHLGIPPVK